MYWWFALWHQHDFNFDRYDMRDFFNIAAYESFFIFDQVIYRQFDGVGMGSLMGPILPTAFLCHFEKHWLLECLLPWYFTKSLYVDDIFVIIVCQSHLKDFENYINNKYPNIKFTLELEENYSFSFLDVKITRRNIQVVTSVFRMAILSCVFTNFESCIPVAYKLCFAYNLLHRSFSICSSNEKFHEEIVLLKYIFKNNKYPRYPHILIGKWIKKYWSKLFVPKRIVHTVYKKQGLLILPLSFEIRSRL